MKLILASGSPRRAAILNQIGIKFEKIVSHADEETNVPSEPVEHVKEVSRRKALAVANHNEGIILGADTIVVVDGSILGKPKSTDDAFNMLSKLNARRHQVYTGITLINTENDREIFDYECTHVHFRNLTNRELWDYIETGEPMDKAGAYGIQGKGAVLVQKIDGCYYNVVGLPVARLLNLL